MQVNNDFSPLFFNTNANLYGVDQENLFSQSNTKVSKLFKKNFIF